MQARQHKKFELFVRVRAFLEAYPVPEPLAYGTAREMLDDAVLKLRQAAGAEQAGREATRRERRRQEEAESVLVDAFARRIVTIAKAQIEPTSPVGLPEGLRMPKVPAPPSRLLAVSDGMIEAARAYESVFVQHGMPADFLAQFAAARDDLQRVLAARATEVTRHVAARAGVEAALSRGRLAVNRLDAIVRLGFKGNEAALRAWNSAKRLQRLPVSTSGRPDGTVGTDGTAPAGSGTPAVGSGAAGTVPVETRQAA